jgi:hypothetical protein
VINNLYNVAVRAQYRNVWGANGNICEAKMSPPVVTTTLAPSSCENNEILIENGVILLQPIEEATVYELELTEVSTGIKTTIQNDGFEFATELLSNLIPNTGYTARARAQVNDFWIPWGAVCNIGFIDKDDIALNLQLYPNPINNGEELYLQTSGDWMGAKISLVNMIGRVIIERQLDFKNAQPQTMRIPKLPQGVYLLQLTHGKQALTKKFIIQ